MDLLDNERWWGGRVADGHAMPIAAGRHVDLHDHGDSQAASLLVSSRGRVISSPEPFTLTIDENSITFDDGTEPTSRASIDHVGTTLADAVRWAATNVHGVNGAMPDIDMFLPQWALWIELLYEPTQDKALAYANAVLDNGFSPGVVMIDDNWSEDYGVWKFRTDRFPDPKSMVDQLHETGFSVMLWVCPYVSPDGLHYLQLRDQGLLLSDRSDEPVIRRWWNGYSAVLDLTNPATVAWFEQQLRHLQDEFGIDGFKFDGGDIDMYADDDATWAPSSPADQVHRYGRFAERFSFNELRSGWNLGGLGVATRLSDANHSWDELGLGKLIGNQLLQGLLGMPFSAPDMIGGGQYLDFDEDRLDQELFVRHAQIAALSPMMQFSAAPWRLLDDAHATAVHQAAETRREHHDLIVDLAKRAALTGEPIMRPLEYEFPHAGLESVTDCFMLGGDLLVAPVTVKGAHRRSVPLPPGQWAGVDGSVIDGGQVVEIPVELGSLPFFERRTS